MRAGLVCAAAGTILAFSTGLADRYALAKFLVLALGTTLAWLALVRKRGIPLHRTPLDLPMAALLAAAVVSALFSLDPALSFIGHYRARFNSVLTWALCMALFQAVARCEDEDGLRWMLDACLVAGALAGLYAVAQWFGIEPFAGVVEELRGNRSYSTLGSPVYLGSVLLMLLPLALHKGGAPGIVSGLLIASGLAATLSRGAWLGAIIGCGLYLGWKRLDRKVVLALLLCAGAAVLAGTALRRTAVADSSRVELWRCASRISLEHPWLGTGPETFKLAFRRERSERYVRLLGPTSLQAFAHNDLLEAACSLGLLGLAAYLWLLWGAFRLFRPVDGLSAALGGGVLGLFIQMKFNPAPAASYALAAAFAGVLAGPSSRKGPRAGVRLPAAVLGVCAAVLLLAVRMAAADRSQKLGLRLAARGRAQEAAARFEKAIRLVPWEMHYRFSYTQFLHAHGGFKHSVDISREAMRRHPRDFDALQLYGVSLILANDRLAEAREVLERAQGLDPYFLPLYDNRIALARMMGDAEAVSALEAELAGLKTRLGL
ncbi:MAG: O-antigen ligase family protein [Elusimicrobiota bacterium]